MPQNAPNDPNPEVAPQDAATANGGPPRPPVVASQAPPVAGEDALRLAAPARPARREALLPPPMIPAGDLVLAQALAGSAPVVGRVVPAAPPPGSRMANLGDVLAGFSDQIRELGSRLYRLEEGPTRFFAESRQRLDREIAGLKAASGMALDEVMVHAENRAREIAVKVDERYAGRFAQVDEALKVLADGCAAMSDAHKLIAAVSGQAEKAAKQAGAMAAKIDILAGTVDQVKTELGSEIDAVDSGLKAVADKALLDSAKALKLAEQAAKDLMGVNGRVQALENYRKQVAQAGTGKR